MTQPVFNIVKVNRLKDADYAICRVDNCLSVDKLNNVWSISKSKWMHETGIGSTDARHRVDYFRIDSVTPGSES